MEISSTNSTDICFVLYSLPSVFILSQGTFVRGQKGLSLQPEDLMAFLDSYGM